MKTQKQFVVSATFLLMVLSISLSVYAQEAPQKTQDNTFYFVTSEMSFDSKVVKGAPYSAQATTETTQTLGDGNRIKRTNTANVYRDNEGRTRREQQLSSVGPWSISGEAQQTVFINDPVAGINYILMPRTHTAKKMPLTFFQLSTNEGAGVGAGIGAGQGNSSSKVSVSVERNVTMSASTGTAPLPPLEGAPQEFTFIAAPNGGTTESLGKQTIEGVVAEGTRTTVTIPAGKIGNELPIQIVTEKWYSPELQTVIMSKHSDPMVGETVYRLTNIIRSEPAHTLFEVPSDYTIQEIPVRTRVIRKKSGEEEK